jgi:TRAP-type C4-dicarboxylate transport system permease small subunit
MAYAGWNYVIETRGATSAAIGFPIEFLYASAPAFGVLIALFSLERLLPWAESLNE